jgi:hypothetical protein
MEQIMMFSITREELKQIICEALHERLTALSPPQFDDKLLSISEACKVFQPSITRQTLNNWRKLGLIQPTDKGKSRWYKLSELLSATKNISRYDRKSIPTKNLKWI